MTLASERLLAHKQRLLPAQRKSEEVLSYCAIGSAILGGIGLILLSIFDTLRYQMLHRVFLFIFMLGVTLSAIFTIVEVRLGSGDDGAGPLTFNLYSFVPYRTRMNPTAF